MKTTNRHKQKAEGMDTNPSGPAAGQSSSSADVMLTKRGMAERMHLTVRTVENWQRRGLLPYFKVDKVVLFYWPDVVEHLKRNYRVCNGPCPGPCRTGQGEAKADAGSPIPDAGAVQQSVRRTSSDLRSPSPQRGEGQGRQTR